MTIWGVSTASGDGLTILTVVCIGGVSGAVTACTISPAYSIRPAHLTIGRCCGCCGCDCVVHSLLLPTGVVTIVSEWGCTLLLLLLCGVELWQRLE